MQNNIWFGFRPLGGVWDNVKNITFDGNVIAHVVDRETYVATDWSLDKKAGLAVCTVRETLCTDLSIVNNLVAGVAYAGFMVPGHKCGDTEQKIFRDNTAHSIAGPVNEGHGAIIYGNKGMEEGAPKKWVKFCVAGSHFTAWKCHNQGAMAFNMIPKVIMSDMTMIDNKGGFGATVAQRPAKEYNGQNVLLENNHIYGETEEISDCPPDGSYCIKYSKGGAQVFSGEAGPSQKHHMDLMASLPFES